jgi:murein DD-endopeptidase MepM/ murein hydrolase activator NlpD
MQKFIFILLIVLLAGASGTYLYFAEGQAPTISFAPEKSHLSPGTEITVEAGDSKSGLAFLEVIARQGTDEVVLHSEEYPKGRKTAEASLSLKGAGLEDGKARMVVRAADHSWTNFFQGNLVQEEREFVLDSDPPKIIMKSFTHNLNLGGSGLLGFRVSEQPDRAGVEVKGTFFPAYEQPNGVYLCFFAFPFFAEPGQDRPKVMASDRAGNVTRVGIHHYVNDKVFDKVRLPITDSFLQNTMGQFQNIFPETQDDLELFLKVNRELRTQNRKELQSIGRETSSRPLWEGRFLRQPGAARRASFGTQRFYVYQKETVDTQTHLGVDLASLAQAKVPAANSGRIVYADWLGIYGQVVIVDHGLGLQTLYAHLSQIGVSKGDRVKKGQIIGRTGATGLAGGDHLHLGVLISGIPVNPVEWWDKTWIEHNVQTKLALAETAQE